MLRGELYENHLDKTEARWFAVYTRYKREKVVCKDLERKGIETYLPLQKLYKLYARKKKLVEKPLFSCYVFVKITKDQHRFVQDAEGVVDFVRFSKNLISIPDNEIEIVKRIVGESLEIVLEDQAYHAGDAVEVVSGSLSGLKGKLLDKKGKKNFLVQLNQIGYNLLIEIKPKDIRKIDRRTLAVA